MQRMDRRVRFVYLPRQAAGLEDRYPLLVNSDFNPGMRLIERADKIYSAADAVYQIAADGRHSIYWLGCIAFRCYISFFVPAMH